MGRVCMYYKAILLTDKRFSRINKPDLRPETCAIRTRFV